MAQPDRIGFRGVYSTETVHSYNIQLAKPDTTGFYRVGFIFLAHTSLARRYLSNTNFLGPLAAGNYLYS
jgi:hypothetical protein